MLAPRVAIVVGTLASLSLASRLARAADDDVPERAPLPESILTESVTDVDAHEAGEFELESNLSSVGATDGTSKVSTIDVEVEMRVLSFLGARIEPSFSRTTYSDAPTEHGPGVSGGLAVTLLHDFRRDAHVQLEINARHFTKDDPRVIELGETLLPYEPQVLGAIRFGRVTFRGSVGAEFGPGTVAHAPIDLEASMLTDFDRDAHLGFFGIETDVDLARTAPWMIAPDVVTSLTSFGLPFEIGVAVPWYVGSPTQRANLGVLFRIFYLSEREVAFGKAPM